MIGEHDAHEESCNNGPFPEYSDRERTEREMRPRPASE